MYSGNHEARLGTAWLRVLASEIPPWLGVLTSPERLGACATYFCGAIMQYTVTFA